MSEDLITKLRAALDTAEHLAQRATAGPWRYNPRKHWIDEEDPAKRELLARCGYLGEEFVGAGPADATIGVAATGPADHPQSMADAEFIAAWGPDRALWFVTYFRELVEDHAPRPLVDPDGKERPDWPERACRLCCNDWMGTPDWAKGDDFVPPEPEYCDEFRRVAEFWLEGSE